MDGATPANAIMHLVCGSNDHENIQQESTMRLPRVKLTVNRSILAVAIVSGILPGLLIERVSLGGWLSWVLVTVGLASPVLFLAYLLSGVLTHDWQRGERGQRAKRTIAPTHRPQFTVLQLLTAMAIVTVICWVSIMLFPVWWGLFHQPSNAEMAAELRLDAAHWTRLAIENPSLAKEYLRLADRSIMAAERFERRAKASVP
jgi:hypothetical protein